MSIRATGEPMLLASGRISNLVRETAPLPSQDFGDLAQGMFHDVPANRDWCPVGREPLARLHH